MFRGSGLWRLGLWARLVRCRVCSVSVADGQRRRVWGRGPRKPHVRALGERALRVLATP